MIRHQNSFLWALFGTFLLGSSTFAVSTVDVSATAGAYQDIQKKSHLPVYTSIGYTGLHASGIESEINVTVFNDLQAQDWNAFSSQVSLTIPLKYGYQDDYRRSSLQLGRQLFVGLFDLNILDGFQLPLYFSATSGVRLFGGTSQANDLESEDGLPLGGAEWFFNSADYFGKLALSGQGNDFDKSYVSASLGHEFSSLPLLPGFSTKVEYSLPAKFNQSYSEISINPRQDIFLSTFHSYRQPHKYMKSESVFLYSLLSSTPQETVGVLYRQGFTPDLSLNFDLRSFSYGAPNKETGQQQNFDLIWEIGENAIQLPSITHTSSFGGDLWDVGASWQRDLGADVSLNNQFAVAYFDKINQITGYGYNFRTGAEWKAYKNLLFAGWGEIERNHHFNFDVRAAINVTYFN